MATTWFSVARKAKNAVRHVRECNLNAPCECDVEPGDHLVYPNEEVRKVLFVEEERPQPIPNTILIQFLGQPPTIENISGPMLALREALEYFRHRQQEVQNYFDYFEDANDLMIRYHNGKLGIKRKCRASSKPVKLACIAIRKLLGIKVKTSAPYTGYVSERVPSLLTDSV